ncbi:MULTISPECIES: sensor histidine kinase [unclassified Streptomyces]|uniref:sensor histidine kinase n=1 Tax=unclassified Streptomyces TaxID=2593676 RepID=UPI000DD53505|nr:MULTISPECIES: sensor histidine kinase [unclassified Streptomyces]QZZ25348.1 sensor histidine kinase [Streptomyces sp. ST1015]
MPPATYKGLPLLRSLPHLLLLIVVLSTLARLVRVSSALCWSVAPPVVLLATGYGLGLGLWDRMGPRVRRVWFALLLGLWAWVAWVLPARLAGGYIWLAVPLAVLALRMFRDWAAPAAVGLITVLLAAAILRTEGTLKPDLVVPPAAAVWFTVALYRSQQGLVHELGRTRDELARRQREAGVLAERSRIARDLHDTLAQELSGNRMLLQAAERDWDRSPEAARRQVHAVAEALGASLADTRSIIRDLTPAPLASGDLAAALRELCTHKGTPEGMPRISFETQGEPREVPPEQAAALLRVTQGLLANACEHADAAQVRVTVDHREPDAVTVEVHDDGIGFDTAAPRTATAPGTAPAPEKAGRGFGLAATRDRLAAYGGTLTVHSTPGHGTRALATLPVPALVTGAPR